jgi:hypothetical protein
LEKPVGSGILGSKPGLGSGLAEEFGTSSFRVSSA